MISRLSPLSSSAAPRLATPKGAKLEQLDLPQDGLLLSGAPPVKETPRRKLAKVLLASLGAVSGLAGLAGAGSAIIQYATRPPDPAATVKAMLAHDTKLAPPAPEQVAELQKSLSVVDPSLLKLAQQQGLVFQLLAPGDNLLEAKVIRPQPDQYIKGQLSQMRAVSAGLAERIETQFNQPMQAEALKIAPPQGFGAPADSHQLAYNDLAKAKNTFIGEQIRDSKLPFKTFSLPIPDGADMNMTQLLLQQSDMPTPLSEMARVHGAVTPEQKAEFMQLVRSINGDRYDRAVKDMIDSMVSMQRAGKLLNQETFTVADEAAMRAKLTAQADNLPLDHLRHFLLVPDLWYQNIDGQTLKLDGHDRGTLENWTRQADSQQVTGKVNTDHKGVLGQYFYLDDVNRVILRDFETTGRSPVHELGHAMEHLLEKLDPTFYKSWKQEVQSSYDAMMKHQAQPITYYSETNTGEYVAEGFAHYFLNPQELASKDEHFQRCIQSMVERLRELAKTAPTQAQAPAPNLADWLRVQ